MAITLTANGYRINNGTEITDSSGKVKTFNVGENSTRQSISQTSGTIENMWECVTNFNKKSSTSVIVVEGNTVGFDAYSYPYGGTMLRFRHSDGTYYRKQIGSLYVPSEEGNHTVMWWWTGCMTASDLGNKTGDFDVFWAHSASNIGGDTGHQPWNQQWNWNSNEDSRAYQQGSHTAVYEIES